MRKVQSRCRATIGEVSAALVDVFDGREPRRPPALGEEAATALEHAELLIEFLERRWRGLRPVLRVSAATLTRAGR